MTSADRQAAEFPEEEATVSHHHTDRTADGSDPGGPAAPTAGGLTYRGVCYDTGSNFATGQGDLSRTVWSTSRMREEIRAVSDDLHCNSITVYGTDLDRLRETSTTAVERGLHVWLQPRLVDRPQDEILDHLAQAARHAEELRRRGARIGLNVGCEYIFFTPEIVPGGTYHERMANLHAMSTEAHLVAAGASVDIVETTKRLNVFLTRAAAVAREHFQGGITYGAAPFEEVDWQLFDFVGVNHYYSTHPTRAGHVEELNSYLRWGRPLVICEFGTATYRGAGEKGALAFNIVDRSGPVPLVLDGYVRDEQAQADHHLWMLGIYEEVGVHSAAVYEFIHPTHPHSTDPRHDLDTASMAIVKTIREDPADPGSPYRWEPKQSFRSIAAHYAAAAERERAGD